MFENGAWIEYKVEKLTGFVVFSNALMSTVCFVKDGRTVRTQNVTNGNIHRLGEKLKSDELFELINVALLMRDREWFENLSGRLRQLAEREMAE